MNQQPGGKATAQDWLACFRRMVAIFNRMRTEGGIADQAGALSAVIEVGDLAIESGLLSRPDIDRVNDAMGAAVRSIGTLNGIKITAETVSPDRTRGHGQSVSERAPNRRASTRPAGKVAQKRKGA